MKSNSRYWTKRINKQQEALYDKSVEETQKKLQQVYNNSMKVVKADMTDLYLKIIEGNPDGTISINDLYKFNRLSDLQVQLYKQLKVLGNAEIDIMNERFTAMYKTNESIIHREMPKEIVTGTLNPASDKAVKEVLNSVWCADGKTWSARVWNNKMLLQQRVERGLVDCVARGVAKDELVKQLMTDFKTGFMEADRIVRTELTFVQGQSTAKSYQSAGIEKYEFLAAHDSRTSDICKGLDGKIFAFSQMKVGKNYPPTHVYCRSTVTPVL